MSGFRLPLIILVLLTLLSGCSEARPVDPISPALIKEDLSLTDVTSESSRYLWGYWQCEFDLSETEIVVVPARGPMMHVNLVGNLNQTSGLGVSIEQDGTDFPNGLIVLKVDLTHPFANNDKFTGFDVRGILITTAGLGLGDFKFPGPDDPDLLNADGYTRWWNPVEFTTPGLLGYTKGNHGLGPPEPKKFTSMINPYKQFADALGPDDPLKNLEYLSLNDPDGRGVFRSGATNSRKYEIQFPVGSMGPKVWFNYAVDASWAAPLVEPPSIPVDFPPNANAPEAFRVSATIHDSDLWIDQDWNSGGELELRFEITDWQGWMNNYDNEFGGIHIVSPYCDFSWITIDQFVELGPKKAIIYATVTGFPLVSGPIDIWVGVEADGTTYKQATAEAPDAQVAAYTRVQGDVMYGECIPNGYNDCGTAIDVGWHGSVEGTVCNDYNVSDFYTFSKGPGAPLVGEITVQNGGFGNINLFLYEGCPPNLIDSSVNILNYNEKIKVELPDVGVYYIEAKAWGDGLPGARPYSLTTDLFEQGSECTTDGDNTPDEATPVSLTDSIDSTVCKIGDDVDWYTFEISENLYANGEVWLLNNFYANNDLALYLDPASDPVMESVNSGTTNENLSIVDLPSGTYFLEVKTMEYAPIGDRPYTLELDLVEEDSGCDDGDSNNDPGEAILIEPVSITEGTVCNPEDQDWFKFEVGPEMLSGTITLSGNDTHDNDFWLYIDPYGDPLKSAVNHNNSDEEIQTGILTEGTYYLKIAAGYGSFGENQTYGLSPDLTEPEIGATDFFIHAHVVRESDGSNPAIEDWRVYADIEWASEFYGIWLDGSVSLVELSYVDNTAWLALDLSESSDMFSENKTGSGALHVFYVNDLVDLPGSAAYAFLGCKYDWQSHNSSYMVMGDLASSPTFSHETGHALGLLLDTYDLDTIDCDESLLNLCGPGEWDPYCDAPDGVPGNLMFWPAGSQVEDYFLSDTDKYMNSAPIDSQCENFMYFHTNYPDHFHQP